MKLYEYQAKSVFERFSIPKPDGVFIEKPSAIPSALKQIGKGPWAIKAQVLAGGRGKAGGIRLVKTPQEAVAFAKTIVDRNLVTHQTGPKGEKVVGVLVETSIPKIARELYVSVVLDRREGAPVLIAAKEGGMEIETLAKEKPDSILRYKIDPALRLPPYLARGIAHDLGFTGGSLLQGAKLLSRLVDIFFEEDASLVEVNPLVLLQDGRVMALDGKITTDENALFRHPQQQVWSVETPVSSSEKRAQKAKISYIKLDGSVGCLVNGAGLAMATMDIIKLHGGEPANFLDVGGGATTEQVTEAFKIILSDKRVKGILVNIFGGIMRCDIIANGIVAAAKKIQLRVPLVVRLQGTKRDEGRKILADSKLKIKSADSLEDAAQMIVSAISSN